MRVGVLGCGSIGKRHADNIANMRHDVLIYDPAFSEWEWTDGGGFRGWTRRTNKLDEFLSAELDAVVIASPSSVHVEHLKMLDLYKTKVLIEKPIGATEEDAKILRDTIGLEWMSVGNNLRFHPCVKWAKSAIGGIGKIERASFYCEQFNNKPAYMRDGVTLNWGAHEIDLALYLLGPAKVEFSAINEDDTEAYIRLEHDRGGASNIDLDYIRNPQKRGFLISGDNGNIPCDLESSPVGFDWNQTYIDEMNDFLNGGKQCATGKDGLATLEIILDAKRKAGL